MRSLPLPECLRGLLVALLATGSWGCQAWTPAAADRDVYGLLHHARQQVPDVAGSLALDQAEREARPYRKTCAQHVTLAEALVLATKSSRTYRNERESVYLAALNLTLEQNAFRKQRSGSASLGLDIDESGETLEGEAQFGASKRWSNGASASFTSLTDFVKQLAENPLSAAQMVLNANFTLPLLRGSSKLVVREPLTQAEHELLYALRDYARFQQTFTVDVATQYYRILQLKDIARNERASEERLRRLVEVQTDKAKAGRIAPFQVDQARQDVLRAQDRVQRADADFQNALDAFKLELSLPICAKLELDHNELAQLRSRGLQDAPMPQRRAIPLACHHRLDLRNERNRTRDAKRQILVARDAIRGQLDISLGPRLATPDRQPFNLLNLSPSALLGLELDLPLERTQERNAWRRACLAAVRARRSEERLSDQVVLQVREAYRRIERARRSFDIQKEGVEVAERRVESTEMHLERGTASIRDRLEAEASLVQARNALTSALVDHASIRLSLLRDIGILRVDAAGRWEHVPPPIDAPAADSKQPAPIVRSADVPNLDGAPSQARAPRSVHSEGDPEASLGTARR